MLRWEAQFLNDTNPCLHFLALREKMSVPGWYYRETEFFKAGNPLRSSDFAGLAMTIGNI